MSAASQSILVVEDEENVGSTLVERLKKEHYEVLWARSLEEARAQVQARVFDLVLLDVGLPDGNGFSFVPEIRRQQRATAVVFLTAYAGAEQRIQGLELGAEDYIVKPFHFKELLLRIQNAMKRTLYLRGASDTVQIGRAKVNFARFEVEVDGETHVLTQKECALLKLLSDRRGNVVSRDEILNFVWSSDEYPSPRTIDNFIMKLRRLIETGSNQPEMIRSVRGVGYILEDLK